MKEDHGEKRKTERKRRRDPVVKGKGAGTGRLGWDPAAGENRTVGAGPGGWEETKKTRNEKRD